MNERETMWVPVGTAPIPQIGLNPRADANCSRLRFLRGRLCHCHAKLKVLIVAFVGVGIGVPHVEIG